MSEFDSYWCFGRAEETLRSAIALRRANRDHVNLYFLSGLAVEHALGAIRTKRAGLRRPDYEALRPTHHLGRLARHGGLEEELAQTMRRSHAFSAHWRAVVTWVSNARYAKVGAREALDLHNAVSDARTGVMPWLRTIYHGR